MSDEFPRCHYCDKLAFEFWFDEIAVCADCLENMSGDKVWRLVQDVTGYMWVTSAEIDETLEVINEGTFKDMWAECQRLGKDAD